MFENLLCALIIAASVGMPFVSNAESEAASIDGLAVGDRLDAYFLPLANQKDFSGIIRIERNGKLIAQRMYGYADFTSKRSHTENSLYSAGSVTKGVVAATLLSLMKSKQVDIEAPISKYIPELSKLENVLVEDVMAHKAGLPRDVTFDVEYKEQNGVVAWLAKNPQVIKEAGSTQYSNIGYELLAEVIESATQLPLEKAVEKEVLKPFGLVNSKIDSLGATNDERGAKGYQPGPDPKGVTKVTHNPTSIGDSGLVTSIVDLSKWARVITSGAFPRLIDNDEGFGSVIKGEENGATYFWVQGSLPGYAAGVTIWPEEELSVAYISNLFSYPTIKIEPILRSIVSGDLPAMPAQRQLGIELTQAHLDMVGHYVDPAFGNVEISKSAENNKNLNACMLDRGPGWCFYLTPIDNGKLHLRVFNSVLSQMPDGSIELIQQFQGDKPSARVLKRSGS